MYGKEAHAGGGSWGGCFLQYHNEILRNLQSARVWPATMNKPLSALCAYSAC